MIMTLGQIWKEAVNLACAVGASSRYWELRAACSPEAMDSQKGRSLARKRNVRDKAREATGYHEKELLHSRLITYVDAL